MGKELDNNNNLGDHSFKSSSLIQGFISKDKT